MSCWSRDWCFFTYFFVLDEYRQGRLGTEKGNPLMTTFLKVRGFHMCKSIFFSYFQKAANGGYYYEKQEYIPVGCVQSAAVAAGGVYPSMHWVGVYPSMHWAGGVCQGGFPHTPSPPPPPPPWTE